MAHFDIDLTDNPRLRSLINVRDVHRRYRAILDTTSGPDFHEALIRSVDDIPWLLADLDRAWELAYEIRFAYANLVAACRAALAAHRDGEDDPWAYLRDELPPGPPQRPDGPRTTWAGPVEGPA